MSALSPQVNNIAWVRAIYKVMDALMHKMAGDVFKKSIDRSRTNDRETPGVPVVFYPNIFPLEI